MKRKHDVIGFGFTLVEWRTVRHKSRRRLRAGLPADLLKMGLYWAAPKYYSAMANVFGKQGNQPGDSQSGGGKGGASARSCRRRAASIRGRLASATAARRRTCLARSHPRR